MRYRAHDVATATGGRLVGPDVDVEGASFDSRTLRQGQLFVPLVTERDGHEYIEHALAAGTPSYLTARGHRGGTAVEVDDTLAAFMALARYMRRRLDGPVVGVTGSVGKTSTKDLARAALAPSRRTWANERSFNNDFGLPATILNAPDDTEVLVVEMGMRGHGEITRLAEVAVPTIGVVTRVAEAHSERVGGIEGVARAKGELIEALPADGVAILNADDPRVRSMRTRSEATVVLYGEAGDADVRVSAVRVDEHARARFRVDTPWGGTDVVLAVAGRHMVGNAAAALAIVGAAGGDVLAGAQALAEAGISAMRMHLHHTPSGAVVLDDSYNANPTSMRAAIDALVDLPARRRVAVLGTMAEITDAVQAHRDVAEYATDRGIEVIAVGTDLYQVQTAVGTVDEAADVLGSLARGDAVLVKGSRVVGLDRLAAMLLGG
jgi:UDP-N-acetylmuramoyl-tripeptide--D-alanyl-D-alanine ligase